MRFYVIKKSWLILSVLSIAILVSGWFIFRTMEAEPTFQQTDLKKEYEINMVTGEFKSQTKEGKEIEAYRWDPATIVLPKGENVQLKIYGVNGMEHPFTIEGTDIKGTVKKGKETVVDLRFDEEGIYRLICETHSNIENDGPMVAYLVVD
ncbi:cupredoxin domain-containing protein [Metabacillus arenae]|uniref:Cupredoxin domain-containing protein n=1 Tax=Metabacillus arenae TaxID=2771434 RepID=A0A926ND64_9BACI|nr:cupredoxin domain-containing protein [Metabacillus arenae]MBD1378970.1 cupredoxin domain-containing protein [Metabacillus arenae]